MILKKFKITIILLISTLILCSCSSVTNTETTNNPKKDGNKLVVYTSFYPIYDFTKKITSDKVDLQIIIPAGSEPHDFEIGAKTIAQLENADLIILNGLDFEPWADSLPDSISSKIVKVGELVEPNKYVDNEDDHSYESNSKSQEEKHSHSEYDPHVWLDPVRAIKISEVIYENIIKLDSINKDYYNNNYNILIDELKKLDEEYSELTNLSPKKKIVVSHNAFSYLEARYNLDFHSITGASPHDEPSLNTLKTITELVEKEKISVIFFEELANSKVVDTLANESSIKADVLYTIEGMTQDEIDSGEDYFSKMRTNLNKIKLAIQ